MTEELAGTFSANRTNLTGAIWILFPKTAFDNSSLLIFESFCPAHTTPIAASDPARASSYRAVHVAGGATLVKSRRLFCVSFSIIYSWRRLGSCSAVGSKIIFWN